uniref:Mitochondrial import inner membrane translocase subunit n=1 Tax=Lepeophtheirus salmonis TaxID=72036 RepID=D3PIG3_LEPSM|nr:Mitochondrial import inner membrane translocase subunit Tim8 A [Lepeophtheirus salmonis]
MENALGTLLQDPQMQSFIKGETQRQKIQSVLHDINSRCWDTCFDKPGPKLDSRTETCLKNCVDRFLDANIHLTKNLHSMGS